MEPQKDFQDVLQADIITLVVSDFKFQVHVDLMLCQSDTWAELVKKMKDETPESRELAFPDEDPNTFSRFISFCYTGDYVLREIEAGRASKSHRPDSSFDNYYEYLRHCLDAVTSDSDHACAKCGTEYDWAAGSYFPYCSLDCAENQSDKFYCLHCGENLTHGPDLCSRCRLQVPGWMCCSGADKWYELSAHLETRAYLAVMRRTCTETKLIEREDLRNSIRLSDDFESHVALYNFARKYEMTGLKMKCLNKLARDLSHFKFVKKDASRFTKLIRVVYEDTTKGDILRQFMARFAVRHKDVLLEKEDFYSLLADFPDASVDMLRVKK